MLSYQHLARFSAMACLTAPLLAGGGCGHHWRDTPELGDDATRSMGVLAELGIGQHAPQAPAVAAGRRQGPCLVAGDGLAWRWAIAFDMVPTGYAWPAFADANDHEAR